MSLMSNIYDAVLFKQHLKNNTSMSENSIYMYVYSVERFLKRNPDIENIDDYNKFIVDVCIKKRSNHHYSAIKAFIDFRIKDAVIKNRLLKDLIRPKERKDIVRERKNLTDEQIVDIINYLQKDKHQVISWIQKTTGVRAGDVLRLKRGDIMYEDYHGEPVLRINILGKRKKRNVVYIHHPAVQEFIVDWITSNAVNMDYYFLEYPKYKISGSGENTEDSLMKQNYWWYWADLKQAMDLAGVDKKDWASHGFRYSAARVVWDLYKDIQILQNFLGHEDPKTTMRYLRHSGLQNIDLLKEIQMGVKDGSTTVKDTEHSKANR